MNRAALWGLILALNVTNFGIAQDEEPEVVVEEVFEAQVVNGGAFGFAVNGEDPKVAQAAFDKDMQILLALEIGFARRVCDLTADEIVEVKAGMVEPLESMRSLGGPNNAFRMGLGFGGGAVVANTSSGLALSDNPIPILRKHFDTVLAGIVAEDRLANYRRECELRDEFLQDAAIGQVIEMLTKHLSLSLEQQTEMSNVLKKEWKQWDSFSIDTYMHNPEYVPQLPELAVQKVLDEDQRKIWTIKLNKHTFPLMLSGETLGVKWDE